MKIYQLEDDSIERHKGERKVHGVDDDTMSVTDSVATESDLTADTNSVTIDTDSDSDSENDSKSENNEDNERLQESDSENNKSESKSESKSDSGDGVQGIKAERTEESDKDEVSFPDTSISLQHVKGDKYVTSTSNIDFTVYFEIEVKDPHYDLSQHFLISKFYCWC